MLCNNETMTLIVIYAPVCYDEEIAEIADFINRMMTKPMILHGKHLSPGIEVTAIFITE